MNWQRVVHLIILSAVSIGLPAAPRQSDPPLRSESGSDCVCPKEGRWKVQNLEGWMDCTGPVDLKQKLEKVKDKGIIWVLEEDCSSLFGEASKRKDEDVLMERAGNCGYEGTINGEENGITMSIEVKWSLEGDEFIKGEMHSNPSLQGMTCEYYRPFEITYDEAIPEDEYAKLKKKMEKKLEKIRGSAAPAKAPEASCTCEAARLDAGWCELHNIGYVASIPIRSRLLYETLDAHGHTIDPAAITCESCMKAIRTDGFCERDRIGFVETQAYFSRLTYELARGQKRDPQTIDCPVCRKNSESHGWCETHGVGMIGAVQAEDRQGYDKAVAAVEILIAANEMAATCEDCAMAMVTDSLCALHRINYKDGKPVVAAP